MKQLLAKKYLIYFITLSAYLPFYANSNSDTIYNRVINTEFAEKYPDLKYDPYNAPAEKEQVEQKTNTDFEIKPKNKNINNSFLWATLILIFGILLFLLYKNKGFGIFRLQRKVDAEKILEAEKYIHELDLDGLLNNAIAANNKTEAIRFYFLKFLKTIADNNHIDWQMQKTNNEYLHEIKITELKADFKYANYLYNYIWFGKFDINDDQFISAQNFFNRVLKQKY